MELRTNLVVKSFSSNVIFQLTFSFYLGSKLHFSDGACPIKFAGELEFWGVPATAMESCCMKKFLDAKELLDFKRSWEESREEEEEQFNSPGQRKIWNVFDKGTVRYFSTFSYTE